SARRSSRCDRILHPSAQVAATPRQLVGSSFQECLASFTSGSLRSSRTPRLSRTSLRSSRNRSQARMTRIFSADTPAPVNRDISSYPSSSTYLSRNASRCSGRNRPSARSIGAGEGILQRFLRVLAIAEHVQRIASVPIAVTLYQLGIELGVAPEHALDDLRVRATIHEGQTLA